MTLAHIATGAGIALCILIGLFFAVLVIGKRTQPTGDHRRRDDPEWISDLRDMPEQRPAPPHPDGGVTS